MESPALRRKIELQRRAAPRELPKARLCGAVVHALVDGGDALDHALRELRNGLGGNWHVVTAFQFMSGRQALLAAECAPDVERERLVMAHRIAEAVSFATAITRCELAQLRAACVHAAATLRRADN